MDGHPAMKKLLSTLFFATVALTGVNASAADAEAGKAKAAACGACHGADGNSSVANWPKLAGQGEKYLIKQIKDIQTGARPVAEMTALVANLSDQDIADIAAYYAAQTATGGNADPSLVERGQSVYQAGNYETGVAACLACHSPTGKGNAPAGFPSLAGQHAAYIEKQLKDFRLAANEPNENGGTHHGRDNDGESQTMRLVAKHMSDIEIRAVASYIQGLY